MPFYLVTQKGIPGARLVEADKPQQARDHVIHDTIDVNRVEGRELLNAAKMYDPEIAGQASGTDASQGEGEPEGSDEQE